MHEQVDCCYRDTLRDFEGFFTQLNKILHKEKVNRAMAMGDTVIKRSNPIEKCKNANKGHARCSGRHQSRLLLDIYIYT